MNGKISIFTIEYLKAYHKSKNTSLRFLDSVLIPNKN